MSSPPRPEFAEALLAAVAEHDTAASLALPPADTLLAAAIAARPAGRPAGVWAHRGAEPVAAFATTVAELDAVLAGLSPQDGERPVRSAHPTWRVRDVVAHLVAVDRYQLGELGGEPWSPPPGTELDHLAMTEPVVAELAELSWEALLATWRAGSAALVARGEAERAAGRLDDAHGFTGLTLPLRALLIVRVFEIWTHTDDVRAAVGLPLAAPDPERLTLMSALAVRALPLGLAVAGRSLPGRTVRLVLTGPGGGAWSQSLDLAKPAGEPDVVMVADVVDFCRLAAKRLPAADLAVAVSGDESLVADVLAGAAVFAA